MQKPKILMRVIIFAIISLETEQKKKTINKMQENEGKRMCVASERYLFPQKHSNF